MEIDFIKRMNTLVKEMNRRPDYSVFAAFRTVDRYQEGSINISNLQEFFRGFGNYLVEQEVFAVVRRMDTDGDAKVSFQEFAEFFGESVNEETALTKRSEEPINTGRSSKKSHKSQASAAQSSPLRETMFSTDSKLGASIEKMLNKARGMPANRRGMGASMTGTGL